MLGLSRFVLRHKRIVVALWMLVLIGGVPNLQRATNALSQEFSVPGREGFETNLALFKKYGIDPAVSSIVPVFRLPAGTTVDSPGVKAQIAAAMARATAAVPRSRAVSYASTGNKMFVSADGRTTYAIVWIPFKAKRGFTGANTETNAIRAALQKAPPAGAVVHVTGYDALNDSASGGKGPGVLIEAMIGGLGALIVLAFVFASFIAIVPIVMAISRHRHHLPARVGPDDGRERLVHRPVPGRADRPRRLHRLHAARRPALARGARPRLRRTTRAVERRWRQPGVRWSSPGRRWHRAARARRRCRCRSCARSATRGC